MKPLMDWMKRHREKLLYLFFGGVTTAVNYVVYDVACLLGLPNLLAVALAWVLSVLVAYITNRKWVFQSHTRGAEARREMLAFFAARAGTGLFDLAWMALTVDLLGARIPLNPDLWRRAMKLLSNIFVIVANYVLSKRMIFRGRKS